MKRFFLLFLAFTVSLSVFTVLLPASIANASSPYDDAIRVTSTLSLISPDGTQNVSVDDNQVNNWESYIASSSCASQFLTAKTLGAYAVSQAIDTGVYGYSGDLMVVVYFTSTLPTPNITFGEFNPGQPSVAYMPVVSSAVIRINNSGNITTTCNLSGLVFPLLSTGGNVNPPGNLQSYVYFSKNFSVSYPFDYEGVLIPNSPSSPAINYAPEIGFHLTTEKQVKAIYNGNPDLCIPVGLDEPTGCVAPLLTWTVYSPDGETILEQKTTQIFTPYEYTFPGNDIYYFEVTFTHPGPPYAPFSSTINIVPTKFTLNVNGTFIVGGTALQDCEVVSGINECGEPNPLEDCTTYGTNFGGYFQCVINNFGIWLRNLLIDLFVPSYSFFGSWTEDFGQFLNTKLGFLYTSFATITTLFTGIIANGSTGTCAINPPGELFGATVSFDVCDFEQAFGSTIWGIMQGVVISLTILALIFAGYRKYLDTVDHR